MSFLTVTAIEDGSPAIRTAQSSETMTRTDRVLAETTMTNDQELADELDAVLKRPAPDVLSEEFRKRLDEDLIGLTERQDQRRRKQHEYLIRSQADLDALWFGLKDFDFLSSLKR